MKSAFRFYNQTREQFYRLRFTAAVPNQAEFEFSNTEPDFW